MSAPENVLEGPSDLSPGRARILFAVLLAAAGLFRFSALNWDEGHHLHPDERFISMVEESVQFPKSLAAYFDSAHSPLDPYNRKFDSFPYGTLQLFLTKAVALALRKDGYGGAYLVGRALSGAFDLISIWLVYLIARRFGGRAPALSAAALFAFCPLSIQLSHYWAAETFLAALTAATLLGCVRIAQRRSGPGGDAATGVALGLAVGSKITGFALFGPVGLALIVAALSGALPRGAREWTAAASKTAGRFLLVTAAALVAVRVAAPYMFLGPGPLSFRLDPRYLRDIHQLSLLSSTVSGYPPALQWAGRTVVFPLRNFIVWGAGPFFGIAALAALVWAAAARRRMWPLLPIAAHAVFLMAYHGFATVKAMRYWYPVYPGLAVLAGVALCAAASRAAARRGAIRFLRWAPAAAVAGTFLWGFAFSRIYTRPVTRIAASDWIYRHVPPPARFANESWDDGLPLPRPGFDNGRYAGPVLAIFDPDSEKKADEVVKALAGADWVAVTSNRVYANVTRVPDVFPMSIAYYRALFEGRLGFERVADFSSYPSLGPLRFPDDRAEEQFTVYDHPRVLLFRKTRGFSEARARQILLAAIPTTPPAMWDWEKWPRPRRRVSDPVLPGRSARAEQAPAGRDLEKPVSSWAAALLFYLAAAALAAFAFPLAFLLLPKLQDRGAGFARVFGLMLATYLLSVSVHSRLLRNGRPAAIACLLLIAVAGLAVLLGRRRQITTFWRERRRQILQGEIAFTVGFLFFVGMRALNPEIYWGEKPMDFSILNILVRTPTLPPSDPWLSGTPLSYYTFGHEMIAFLTLVTGLSTRYTFNLAFGWIGGTLVQGAFTLARDWGGTLRAGVAGAAFTGFLGNLAGLREWLITQPATGRIHHLPPAQWRHLDWHYFWATSRVIPGMINEYPFWNLLFADLHAHVLAMPLLLFVIVCSLNLVRILGAEAPRWGELCAASALIGAAAAAQALTNAWDVPLLAGLVPLLWLVTALARGRPSWAAAARATVSTAVTAMTGFLLVRPLWVRGGSAPSWGRVSAREYGALGIDIVTVFGLFFLLAIVWWLVAARSRLARAAPNARAIHAILLALGAGLAAAAVLAPDAFLGLAVLLFLGGALLLAEQPDDRLALGLLATGFFLILFPQRMFIYDRMNTFFKLYLEAWLILAVTTAALVFRNRERTGSFSIWPWGARILFFVALALALFTTVTAGQGAIDRLTAPNVQETHPASGPRRFVPARGPTLDGLRYLEDKRPGEYQAVLWLRRSIRGTPVVLEAQGPTYQDFGRISMLTGLPTVLGWEYHVQQRGNPQSETDERKSAVAQIYSSSKASDIERLLRRYHVGYVYVGWLERQTYPAAGLAKFATAPDLFEPVYENPQVRIYRVVGGETQDVLAPTREALPETAAANRPPEDEPEDAPAISERPKPDFSRFAGMKEPRDAAVDGKGRLWVADFGNSRVRVFDAAGGFLGGWGGRGSGTFGLKEPCAVAADGDQLYVADTWNGRVQHYTQAGEYRSTAPGLYGPRGVAVAADGTVWVTDTGNHRVIHYDASLGPLRIFGSKGAGVEQFSGPVGIAVGPSGKIYVADAGNRRIQVLQNNRFERPIPFPGWADSGQEPHIEVAPHETLFVTDPARNAVVALSPEGALVRRWTSDDSGASFARPTGVAIDRERSILYVVNSGNSSVTTIKYSERETP